MNKFKNQWMNNIHKLINNKYDWVVNTHIVYENVCFPVLFISVYNF